MCFVRSCFPPRERDLCDAFAREIQNFRLRRVRENCARAENAMKLTSRTTFPPSGKEKGTRENGEVRASNSFSDEVAFHEGEYLEKVREFRALVLRRIRAHIDDEDEKEEEEEEEEEENEDD